MKKTKKIQSYLKEENYNFIKELAEKNNISISNTIENIIIKERQKKEKNKMLSRE